MKERWIEIGCLIVMLAAVATAGGLVYMYLVD
jgi:hypothetical protein